MPERYLIKRENGLSEKYIKESEERFRLALEAADIGIWDMNIDSEEISFSSNMIDLMKIRDNNFDGKYDSFINLIYEEDRKSVKRILDNSMKKGLPFDTEFRLMTDDDQIRWLRIRGNIAEKRDGEPVRLLGSIHDKTDRRIALDALEEAHSLLEKRVKERTEELEEINRKLREEIAENRMMKKVIMDISEKERQKIGQDLHDGLLQQIGGIIFMIQAVKERLENKKIPENKDLSKVVKYLNSTLSYVRNLSKGLYLTFGETGLKFAISELIDLMKELYGISIKLSYGKGIKIEDEKKAVNIYRIIQEALNNAVKHGNAKKAEIILRKDGEKISLFIKDNGSGFPRQPNKRGMGLKIMKYRVTQLGSVLNIESSNKTGTVVSCTFNN